MTVLANTIGTFNMLHESLTLDYKGFINFSTSAIDLPFETFYTASKAGAERIAKAFKVNYRKPIVSVRPFSVYGPREADFRLIPKAISSLGGLMKLDHSAVHDWIYIDDFIDGLMTVIENIENIDEPVNIGTGRQYTNGEVVDKLRKVANRQISIEYTGKQRVYDTDKWVADISLLKSFGWKPKYSLQKGLKKTYEYYRQ